MITIAIILLLIYSHLQALIIFLVLPLLNLNKRRSNNYNYNNHIHEWAFYAVLGCCAWMLQFWSFNHAQHIVQHSLPCSLDYRAITHTTDIMSCIEVSAPTVLSFVTVVMLFTTCLTVSIRVHLVLSFCTVSWSYFCSIGAIVWLQFFEASYS